MCRAGRCFPRWDLTAAAALVLSAASQQRAEALSLASPGWRRQPNRLPREWRSKFAEDAAVAEVFAVVVARRSRLSWRWRLSWRRHGVPKRRFPSGGVAFRGGGFRAAHIYRGGGYRYSGLRYGGYRHAYHRPHFRHRHFHRGFYRAYYARPTITIRAVAGSSGPITVRARSAGRGIATITGGTRTGFTGEWSG